MSDTTTKLTYLVGAKRLQEKNRDTEYLLSQEQLEMFESLARADERERLYGKDIDTFLFEEHQLAFEKGRRSERKACAEAVRFADNGTEAAEIIRARGNT